MPPQISDTGYSPDLTQWLATVRSFADNWPQGVLSARLPDEGDKAPEVIPFHPSIIAD